MKGRREAALLFGVTLMRMRGGTAALLVALALCASAFAYAAPVPRLRVAEKPFVVRGTNFQPGELIKLTLIAGGTFSRTIRATARGTFVVRFLRASSDECNGYSASARGSNGSRATIRVTRKCTTGTGETTPP